MIIVHSPHRKPLPSSTAKFWVSNSIYVYRVVYCFVQCLGQFGCKLVIISCGVCERLRFKIRKLEPTTAARRGCSYNAFNEVLFAFFAGISSGHLRLPCPCKWKLPMLLNIEWNVLKVLKKAAKCTCGLMLIQHTNLEWICNKNPYPWMYSRG